MTIHPGARCFGRRGRLPKYNLILHGAEYCAAHVMSRIKTSHGRRTVSVDPAGGMVVYAPKDPRVATKPDEWVVGLYGKAIKLSVIQADLQIRLDELAASR